uniref:EF-hand domain-containing protein n=1 Tax=Pyramimonas obovata TaxID=1411642 RepID=A0A7S0R0L7_9CHLO|mmetsp:Transcript_22156/g.48624  ORF Transcript_22156/g.48624 Transcript_22156/m.48624 type:complete len:322 (+) Transcript_22156:290-1255(+)|eukprot:CAMPEP_0118935822 /NCGR_PEP_ID=MMETSP1169-20130426/15848_1 /TAXON_ID=36882 /ORGANISM="Pyramimonas obovata, Strain CCMP722" /LENGTH=321 /DNA_ID=CAMNT_0006878887 /DNA_START=282 /DNA_END=1247 /DNA_ORIENTATION=-
MTTVQTSNSDAVRLLEAQRARKAAQEDALKLANRVQQLKKEEEKAAKRINETRKRAGEIHKLRKRNEDFRLEKEQFYAHKNRELAAQMENLMTSKRESEKRKQQAAEILARQKRELREATRADQMAHERMLAEQRLMERKVALGKKERVKKDHIVQRDRALSEKSQRIEENRKAYELRLAEELKEQSKKEKELQKLATMELELIEKLQKKQMEQRNAYEDLEVALGLRKPQERGGSRGNQQMTVQEQQLEPEEPDEAEVARQFGVLDVDGTGFINTSQLQQLMESLGIALNGAQLEQATMQLDKNNSGKISYGEFLLWWSG